MTDEVPAPDAETVVVVPVTDGADPADPPADPKAAETPPVEKPVETEEDRERKRKGYLERYLNKAIRREAEQKARADFLERQIQELKPKPPADAGVPKLEDYDDIDKYADAKSAYALKQADNERTTRQRSDAHQREVETLTSGWETKADRAHEKYDDFQAIVGDLQPTTPWTAAIMEAENGEDVAYHLGKNIEEAKRIMSLNPRSQIMAIGMLSAKLAADPPKPKTPSNAPAPIKPVGGSSVTSKSPDQMSDAEFNKWRRSQIAQRA